MLRLARARAVLAGATLPLPELAVGLRERVLVHGPNGCGKTCLAEVVAGLRPYTGDVRVDGLLPNDAHARVGLVLDRPSLPVGVPVATALRHLATAQGFPRQHGDDACRRWRVDGARRPESLSAGEQVRADLARATLHDPPLLVLDEAVAHLDSHGWDLLHDALADRAALLMLPQPREGPWEVRPWA